MTDADVIAAIRANHLKGDIAWYESRSWATVHWDSAWVDRGGTIFGPGPYLHVPVTGFTDPDPDEIVVRVYPPARLRRQLQQRWTLAERRQGRR